MLEIKELHTNLAEGDVEILKGINLEIKPSEIHFIMGPNGSGKSTLANTLAGHPAYEIKSGEIYLDGKQINEVDPSERSHAGLFLAFQYPVEVPGVNFFNFLRLAYNSKLPDEEKLPVFKFRKLVKEKAELLKINEKFIDRNLNEGFSGGEKKKMEILQMAVLQPKYIILDETDSGLDVDALKDVFAGIKTLIKQPDYNPGLLVITHYHRVLDFLRPNYVHIIMNGKIVESGDIELAKKIDKEGYRIK